MVPYYFADGTTTEHVGKPVELTAPLTPSKRKFKEVLCKSCASPAKHAIQFAITSTSPSAVNFTVKPRNAGTESAEKSTKSKSLSDLRCKPPSPSGATVRNLFSSNATSATLAAGEQCKLNLTSESALEIVIQQACNVHGKEPSRSP